MSFGTTGNEGIGMLDTNAENDIILDENGLINAVRSAAEMLAAEGLGSMIDIDFLQNNRVAQQAQALESSQTHGQRQRVPRVTFDDEDDEDEDEEDDGDMSEYSDEDGETDQRPMRVDRRETGGTSKTRDTTRATRSTNLRASGSRSINYNESTAMEDGPVPDGFVEDDEDSNFEESDASASSSDDEYHMQQFEDEARYAAGFGRSGKGARNSSKRMSQKQQRQSQGRKGRSNRIQRKNQKKARQQKLPKYSIEVQRLLGVANQCYVQHDLVEAFNIFCDVIRLDPYCGPAWNTMALIREEEGRHDDALQLYTVSAHLNPSDNLLWDRLYSMHVTTAVSIEEAANAGDPVAKAKYNHAMDQAVYCISFVNRNDPLDKAAWMHKLTVLEKQENYPAMAKAYKVMLRNDPYDMEAIRMASVIYAKKCDDVETPIKWFSDAFAFYNRQAVEVAEDAASRAENGTAHRTRGAVSDDDNDVEEDDYDPEWTEYFRSNPTKTVPMEELGGYSYNDINMMAELRVLRNEYEAAIADIKRGCRFIQSRGREQHWEDQELADENDEEYAVDPENPEISANVLPIELRVKLGQCRLMLGYHTTAQMHIEPLFSLDVVAYEDLYTDVAETYAEVGNPEMALSTYQRLMDREETNQPSVWERMAKCYREMGTMDAAQEYAEAVIHADPSDIDIRLWLAEVYEELGQVDKAYSMIQAVELIQEEERNEQESASASLTQNTAAGATAAAATAFMQTENGKHMASQQLSPMEIWEAPSSVVQIERRKPSEIAIRRRREAEEERKRCIMAMRNAEIAFKKLDLLKPAIDESQDPAAIREYCVTAQRLYNDWRHMRAFFRSDRNKPFIMYRNTVMANLESCVLGDDVDVRSTSSGQVTVQRRLAQMKKRLSKKKKRSGEQASTGSLAAAAADGGDEREETVVAMSFRGQPFDRWFDMFLMYGKCLCLDGEPENALDMLDLIFQSSVFYGQNDKRRSIRLVMLSIAIHSNALDRLYDLVRWWCGSQPNKAVMYKIMGYAISGSAAAMMTLTSANMYKYVRRQLKELNDIYYTDKGSIDVPVPDGRLLARDEADDSSRVVSSVSRVRRPQRDLAKSDISAMHTIAAHVMLVARTGISSIMQYTLALSLTPQDPSVALHLGVAYLSHSVQRKTRDAQAMAIRGLSFIQRYAELQCVAELKARGDYADVCGAGKSVADVVVTQEIAYNFARAFHFLGMLDLAIDNYTRVFRLPVSRLAAGVDDESVSDLRREAAYNLASICIASGAVTQARGLLKKYCMV